MVDMALLVLTAYPYLPQGWMEPEFASEDVCYLALWLVVVDILSSYTSTHNFNGDDSMLFLCVPALQKTLVNFLF